MPVVVSVRPPASEAPLPTSDPESLALLCHLKTSGIPHKVCVRKYSSDPFPHTFAHDDGRSGAYSGGGDSGGGGADDDRAGDETHASGDLCATGLLSSVTALATHHATRRLASSGAFVEHHDPASHANAGPHLDSTSRAAPHLQRPMASHLRTCVGALLDAAHAGVPAGDARRSARVLSEVRRGTLGSWSGVLGGGIPLPLVSWRWWAGRAEVSRLDGAVRAAVGPGALEDLSSRANLAAPGADASGLRGALRRGPLDDIAALALQALRDASRSIGEGPYVGGSDAAGLADAALFAYVACLMYDPLPDADVLLRDEIAADPRLMDHFELIRSEHFADEIPPYAEYLAARKEREASAAAYRFARLASLDEIRADQRDHDPEDAEGPSGFMEWFDGTLGLSVGARKFIVAAGLALAFAASPMSLQIAAKLSEIDTALSNLEDLADGSAEEDFDDDDDDDGNGTFGGLRVVVASNGDSAGGDWDDDDDYDDDAF